MQKEEITSFFKTADDSKFLCTKVILIFGIAGACRRAELTNLLVKDVTDEESCFKVVIPNTKTKISRTFYIIGGDIEGICMVKMVRKYIQLRPKNCDHQRFFVTYRNSKCIKQPIGINTIGSVPSKIAEFLHLPNHKEYTGHCFRRSSTSLLANSGADILAIKRHGGWKSNSAAGYIESNRKTKKHLNKNFRRAPNSAFNIIIHQVE